MRVEMLMVLDRSGSMASIRTETEGAFDRLIEDQRKLPDPCLVTLAQFDDHYEVVYTAKPLAEVPKLTLEPRGYTALFDAIGKTIVDQGKRFAAMPDAEKPEKVILVIVTDGMNNASKEHTADSVRKLIEEQEQRWGWAVTYLGAGREAFNAAADIGVKLPSSIQYDADAKGVAGVMNALNANIRGVRTGGQSAVCYSAEDRADASQEWGRMG